MSAYFRCLFVVLVCICVYASVCSIFVCGHDRKAFCVVVLNCHEVFTRLPTRAPVAFCCYVSMGSNCSLRGADKPNEQGLFLSALLNTLIKHIPLELFKKLKATFGIIAPMK